MLIFWNIIGGALSFNIECGRYFICFWVLECRVPKDLIIQSFLVLGMYMAIYEHYVIDSSADPEDTKVRFISCKLELLSGSEQSSWLRTKRALTVGIWSKMG